MNPAGSPPQYVRRRVLIDAGLQRGLLVALVALEVLLIVATLWLIYFWFDGAIEATLFRVHVADREPLLTRLWREAWIAAAVFLIVNLVTVLIAEGIWYGYVNRVLRALEAYIGAVRALDFAASIHEPCRHEVLRLASLWRNRERARLSMIRAAAQRLELHAHDHVNINGVRDVARELVNLLPQAAGTHASAEDEDRSGVA